MVSFASRKLLKALGKGKLAKVLTFKNAEFAGGGLRNLRDSEMTVPVARDGVGLSRKCRASPMPPIEWTETSSSDASLLLGKVLSDAIGRTYNEITASRLKPDAGTRDLAIVRTAWLRSLRKAFWEHYKGAEGDHPRCIAVFGGKPLEPAMRKAGVPSGIKRWACRWEFLYDIAVVNVEWIDAAFAIKKTVPLIKNAIWLVEFEVADDGTKVGEDASKLRIGRSENTLLIAAQTTQHDPDKWRKFLGKCLRNVVGEVFIALVPSYAANSAEAKQWLNKTVTIMLYRRGGRTIRRK